MAFEACFILMDHQGTENYFSLKETDFGLKTAGGILSWTGCSTPNTQNGSFPSQEDPHTGEPARCTHYPSLPGPSGFARHVSYPLDKALFTYRLTECSEVGVSPFPGHR